MRARIRAIASQGLREDTTFAIDKRPVDWEPIDKALVDDAEFDNQLVDRSYREAANAPDVAMSLGGIDRSA